MRELTLPLASAMTTEALGGALASAALAQPMRCWLLLQGELGAGKSTLARAFLQAAGITTPIPSPTYTLVEPYTLRGARAAVHVDLYRLGGADQLDQLGVSDWDDAIALIEWPERVPELGSKADLEVRLAVTGRDSRCATVRALSALGERILANSAIAQVNSE
ncbi:MAG: tRNA (adenosine(37)-N6)-threonylcarbamoyltransferase complex ATPase subunit type 1 TsaE [Pseudomonadota bacterium]